MSERKFKRCPFCGAIPKEGDTEEPRIYVSHNSGCFFVYIGDPGYWFETEAIGAWNKRAKP